ncbi:AmmeMemoRadiSam system protein A [Geothrix alkalitolerans]|uniref:AmmeMemoRadiSam system protein A n=1 Tax=Geothrix alkalitolerans TaxID=2922724 RepID=UPI001FAEB020|nr:AmmeMemoRadiSam system protein A [Geothrix alkalitolerans]
MTHPHASIDWGPTLLRIARGAIAEKLGVAAPPVPTASWLEEPAATFVTLHRLGQLRGCMGTLEPRRPLGEDVVENARQAAFHDPRFPPLARSEFTDLQVEVSLLSALEPLPFNSQAHLLTLLRPVEDGLVLEWQGLRGAFLPQVWDQLPEPEDFLAHLKRKAGLPMAFWDDGIRITRFTVTRFHEEAEVGSPG